MAALPPSLVPAIDTFVPAERSTMGKKIWSSSIQEILVLTKSSIHMYVDTYVRSFMSADVKCLNYWFKSPRHMQTVFDLILDIIVKINGQLLK